MAFFRWLCLGAGPRHPGPYPRRVPRKRSGPRPPSSDAAGDGAREVGYGGETHLSVAKNYGKSVLDRMARSSMPTEGPTVIPNVDYDEFKLFLISLLWRAGEASGEMWEEVNLGAHEQRPRDMLLNGAPGLPHEYGCITVRSSDMPPQPRRALVAPVSERSAGGHGSYRFLFASMSWRFCVSGRTERLTKHAAHRVGPFLLHSGDLPVHPDFDGVLSARSDQIMKGIRGHRRHHG